MFASCMQRMNWQTRLPACHKSLHIMHILHIIIIIITCILKWFKCTFCFLTSKIRPQSDIVSLHQSVHCVFHYRHIARVSAAEIKKKKKKSNVYCTCCKCSSKHRLIYWVMKNPKIPNHVLFFPFTFAHTQQSWWTDITRRCTAISSSSPLQ